MKIKKINNRWIFFIIVIFFVTVSFGLGKVGKVEAAVDCSQMSQTEKGTCNCKDNNTHMKATCPGCDWYSTREKLNCTWIPPLNLLNSGLSVTGPIIAKAPEPSSESLCLNVSIWGSDLKDIVGCILLYILSAIGAILQFAGTLFGWIVDPANVAIIINNSAVYTAWAFVRDVLNISFILFLLFSAFSTVFQIDKYSYKKTLLTLVLMALLVNFSYPITRFIIDLSNVLMFYLIDSIGLGLGNGFIAGIADKSFLGNIISPTAPHPDIKYLLVSIVFLFVFTVTILAMSLLFLIRTVALAILVIFSSLAFVGEAIPPLSSYSSDWWKKLFSYAFFGPIMVFILVVAFNMMDAIGTAGHGSMQKLANLNSTDPDFIGSLSFFSIPIIILWFGLGIAGKMGIAGASLIVGKAEGFMKGAGKWAVSPVTGAYKAAKFGAGVGLGAVERKLGKGKYTKFLVPRVYKEAYKQRAAIKDREAFEGSTGEMHDLFNSVLSRGKEKTDNAFAAHQGKVSKYSKEISDVSTSSDYVLKELQGAIKNKQLGKAEAALKVLAKENNFNDMMHAMGEEYAGTKTAGPLNIKKAIREMLSKAGAGKNEDTNELLAKQLMVLSDIGVGAGNIGQAGMGKYDAKANKGKGQFIITSDKQQTDIATAKFANFEPQQRQRILHHNSILGEDENGSIEDIDDVQMSLLSKFNEKDLDQMSRSRDDLRRQMKKAQTGVDDDGNKAISDKAKDRFKQVLAKNDELRKYAETVAEGKPKYEAPKNQPEPKPQPEKKSAYDREYS